jgi:hypothetical protein
LVVAGTYVTAVTKLSKAQYTSDLGSDMELGKGKRIAKPSFKPSSLGQSSRLLIPESSEEEEEVGDSEMEVDNAEGRSIGVSPSLSTPGGVRRKLPVVPHPPNAVASMMPRAVAPFTPDGQYGLMIDHL